MSFILRGEQPVVTRPWWSSASSALFDWTSALSVAPGAAPAVPSPGQHKRDTDTSITSFWSTITREVEVKFQRSSVCFSVSALTTFISSLPVCLPPPGLLSPCLASLSSPPLLRPVLPAPRSSAGSPLHSTHTNTHTRDADADTQRRTPK